MITVWVTVVLGRISLAENILAIFSDFYSFKHIFPSNYNFSWPFICRDFRWVCDVAAADKNIDVPKLFIRPCAKG